MQGLNLSLYVDNAESMQFEDNSFDLVIALAMVYCLDVEKFLSEVKEFSGLEAFFFVQEVT